MEVSCYNYCASSVHISFKVSSGVSVRAAAVTVTCLSLAKYICNVLVDTNAFGKVFLYAALGISISRKWFHISLNKI